MGGKEAAAIIRQQNALVPIIFLTGEIAVSMKECVKTFAPSYLLLKPSNKRTLVAVSLQLVYTLYVIRLCSMFESRTDLVASSNTHSVHSSNALSYISASTTAPARAWVRSAMLNAIRFV
jgi:CheY-like chemotaxis protein